MIKILNEHESVVVSGGGECECIIEVSPWIEPCCCGFFAHPGSGRLDIIDHTETPSLELCYARCSKFHPERPMMSGGKEYWTRRVKKYSYDGKAYDF